ncbi:Bug family tripartite tricarboxylate transporter substrate binding protein [Achromobacter aloeverae]|uniref:ABC transporter substrate-binding protein n=1 Tax=Achromobacter aloeverae TaxID=1750518 RepID=A0A4Q1HEU5_9BURK|nr:tripartite tricarboxylate transporter substrate binding protein [Achromobacter aloeverae]RXN84711.1 ABC transporter substrate-binding protein [Achromobacter aloeverae]
MSSVRIWLRHGAAGVMAAAALASAPAYAKYPDHPITVVVPFPAGSGTDAVGRIFAQQLGEILGGQVVVENKPGGNATIGANYVARSKPDGYTLFITTNTSHSAAPFLNKNVPYDPVKDFTPIARGGNLPFILVVNPNLPVKSVQDLVAYAKQHPGKMTYASGNSTGIVAGATFADRAGIKILHVPYKGTPQAMTDVMSGQVDMMFTDVASSLAFVQSGKLRALAVSTAARSNVVPDIPSMQDAGIKNFDINSWNGLLGPAGMPKDVVQQLNAAMNKIVKDPAARKRFADLGFDAFSGTPEDFAAFVSQQRDLWGKMIQDAGIAPE